MCLVLVRLHISGGEMKEMKQKQASKYSKESTNQFSSYFPFCLILSNHLYISVTHTHCCLCFILFHYLSLHTSFFILFPFHSATLFSRILFLSTFLCISFCLQCSCKLAWRRSARCVEFTHPKGWLGGCWKLICRD